MIKKLNFIVLILISFSSILMGQNLLKNGSFEGNLKYWITKSALHTNDAADGSYCAKVSPGFDNALRSGSFQIMPGDEITISFWAKAEKVANVVCTLSPSNRQVAQSIKAAFNSNNRWEEKFKTSTEWQKFTKTYSIPELSENGSFIGSKVTWWNKSSWIIMIFAKGADVFVDGVSIVKGGSAPSSYIGYTPIELAVEATNQTREQYKIDGNLLSENTIVPIQTTIFNSGDSTQKLKIETAVYDYTGTTIFGDITSQDVSLDKKQTLVLDQKVTPEGKGLMLIRVVAKDSSGKVVAQSDEPVTILAFPKAATTTNYDERIGGSIRCEHLVRAGQKIGLGWTRWYPQTNWARVQAKGKDSWAFEKIDATLDHLGEHGILATATLYEIPSWAKVANSHLPKDMNWEVDDPRWDDLSIETAWDKFLKKIVERYKGRLVYELVNEPDLERKWNRKIYSKLVKRSYQIIKNTYPEAEVQVNVTWPGVSAWTSGFIKDDGYKYFDTHTFHNYRPGVLASKESNESVFNLFSNYDSTPKKMWFNEGWMYTPSSDDYPAPQLVNMSAPDAAHIHLRSVVESFAGGVEKFITFHIGYEEHGKSYWDWIGAGTEWWDDNGQPNVAVATYNTMVEELGLSKFVKDFNLNDVNLYVFENNRNNRGVIVLWNRGDDKVSLKFPMDNLVKIDAVGNTFPMENSTIELTKLRPWFIYSKDNLSAEELVKKLEPMIKSSANASVFKLPQTIMGKKMNSSEGSVFTINGQKVWELARTWPASPMVAENYQPLVWKNSEWISLENSFGGQPAIRISNGAAILAGRGAWGSSNPGSKLPALIFHCNEKNVYSISADVTYNTWEGSGSEGAVLLLKESNGEITEITRFPTDGKKGSLKMSAEKFELGAGDKLIITLKFTPYSATKYILKNLTIKKEEKK